MVREVTRKIYNLHVEITYYNYGDGTTVTEERTVCGITPSTVIGELAQAASKLRTELAKSGCKLLETRHMWRAEAIYKMPLEFYIANANVCAESVKLSRKNKKETIHE